MGKHDHKSHLLHLPKHIKFKQDKPSTNPNLSKRPPQAPEPGQTSHNMYK